MTYQETLDFLFNQLANYHKSGGTAYKPGLARMTEFLGHLGNPHTSLNTIHVAGTNGKGSVSHMLASVLQESGYRVGLFTSPHLLDYRERVKVNGVSISEVEVMQFVETNKEKAIDLNLSFFEWTAALAFMHFAQQKTNIAVIEVGLGGRLDATNVIDARMGVITSIGLDHTMFLGDTLEAIAEEKAGIIKPGMHVVLGPGNETVEHVFQAKCEEVGATLEVAEVSEEDEAGKYGLEGDYQNANISIVRQVILTHYADYRAEHWGWYDTMIDEETLALGLSRVVQNTGLRGRFEVISEAPRVILDVAHNAQAISALVTQVKSMAQNVHWVIGMMSDKSSQDILKLLPTDDHYYVTAVDHVRALKTADLVEEMEDAGLTVGGYSSPVAALNAAVEDAGEEGLVVACGSAYLVAEILQHF